MKFIAMFCIGILLFSCQRPKRITNANEFTKEDEVIIELAARLEEADPRFNDYHKNSIEKNAPPLSKEQSN